MKKSLAETHPDIVVLWHDVKNKFIPNDVTSGSHMKVWWKCEMGHEWKQKIYSIINKKYKCNECRTNNSKKVLHKNRIKKNSVALKYPNLIKEWDNEENGDLTPYNVTYASHKKIHWICEEGHKWVQKVSKRTMRNQNCPRCKKENILKENSLQNKYPDIAKQWNYERNIDLKPTDVTYGSHQKVWWRCNDGHEWKAMISNRIGRGCPYCSGRSATDKNSLAVRYLELLKEWDYGKNSKLDPNKVTFKSHKKVWWKCEKGHEWDMMVFQRTVRQCCPYCHIGNYSKIAIKWLNEIANKNNIHVQHAENDGEYKIRINKRLRGVDGYCEENNTIYEYDGCFYHGCKHKDCKYYIKKCKNEINPLNGRKYLHLYNATIKRNIKIKKLGYNLVTIQECQYKKSKFK